MPTYTSNMNLYKWDEKDAKRTTIAEMASNADKIDTKLQEHISQLADIAVQVPEPTGGDDTNLIQSYLDLGKQQKRTVLLKPNKTYIVYRKGTKAIRDTVYSYTYGYSLIVPNGVTFDLNGSTIKLANGQDSLILLNENPDATADATLCIDENIHIKNGVLDQNNVNQTTTYYQGGIYFAKVKNGSLTNLNVINARIDGFRIMGCRNSHFDKLHAKNIQGHGLYIGRKDSTGYDLNMYDCMFGVISGEDCFTGNWNPSPDNAVQNDGNSIHFMAANTTVDTMIDKNTPLGIKIAGGSAGGSKDLQIGKILSNNGAVKFQHTPERVQVGSIEVSNSPIWAVAFIEAKNIQVGKIYCYNCYTTDETAGNVLWCSGTNITIDDVVLDNCKGGGSVIFRTDADNYTIKSMKIIDCKGSVEVPTNGYFNIGELSILKSTTIGAEYRGLNITSANAKCRIGDLTISGNFAFGDYLRSASKDIKIRSIRKEGTDESGRTVTLTASTSTTVTGLKWIYKTYGSATVLPVIRFIPVNSASSTISISRYTINASTLDLTVYHSTATGTEKFIMDIVGYTGADVSLS